MSPSPAISSLRAGKSILLCFAKISHMSCKTIRFLQLQHPEKLYSSQQISGTCKLSIPEVLSRQHGLLCKFGAIWSSHVNWMFLDFQVRPLKRSSRKLSKDSSQISVSEEHSAHSWRFFMTIQNSINCFLLAGLDSCADTMIGGALIKGWNNSLGLCYKITLPSFNKSFWPHANRSIEVEALAFSILQSLTAGISGGQRKRTSVGVELITTQLFSFWMSLHLV